MVGVVVVVVVLMLLLLLLVVVDGGWGGRFPLFRFLFGTFGAQFVTLHVQNSFELEELVELFPLLRDEAVAFVALDLA